MKLVLAPLLTITDFLFRRAYGRYFPELESAIAPFLSLTEGSKLTRRTFSDIDHRGEEPFALVPQLLNHSASNFCEVSRYLYYNFGYEEVNLNLGCPARPILNKGRGSALLSNPYKLDGIFDKIFSGMNHNVEVSVKIRAGRDDFSEFEDIVRVLNKYPFKNVTLHPRIAVQGYSGKVNLEIIDYALKNLRHEIIYSGDIKTVNDYMLLTERFPKIKNIMLGRGLLINPLLPSLIKGVKRKDEDVYKWYECFYQDLINYSDNEYHILGRLKCIWHYLAENYDNPETILTELLPIQSKEKFWELSSIRVEELCTKNVFSSK